MARTRKSTNPTAPMTTSIPDRCVVRVTVPGADFSGHGGNARLYRIAALLCDAAEEYGWHCATPYVERGAVVVEGDDPGFDALAAAVQDQLHGLKF